MRPGNRSAFAVQSKLPESTTHAADRRAVAADVLGRRVHGDVGAVVEHAAAERRRHGVVDDQRQALGVRRVGPGLDVDDVELRVADRLGEHEARLVVGQLGRPTSGSVGVGEPHLDAVLRQRVREQVVGAAVQRRDRDDVVAGAREVEHRVGRPRPGRRRSRRPAMPPSSAATRCSNTSQVGFMMRV